MEAEFCVVCGKTGLALVDGVCASCFLESHVLVRGHGRPDVVVCPTCGARKVGNHWERSGASPSLLTSEDLNPLLELDPEVGLRRVLWTELSRDAVQRSYRGEAEIRFRGLERTVGVDLSVKLRAYTCPECARKAGKFYTAIIQVRGPSERLRGPPRLLRERLEAAFEGMLPNTKSEWRKALSWREELPGRVRLLRHGHPRCPGDRPLRQGPPRRVAQGVRDPLGTAQRRGRLPGHVPPAAPGSRRTGGAARSERGRAVVGVTSYPAIRLRAAPPSERLVRGHTSICWASAEFFDAITEPTR